MHHIAIMTPSLSFIEKILNGQKTIESRWLQQKRAPWQKVNKGDVIFFKDAGRPVTAKAVVKNVAYFENLTPRRVQALLREYGHAIGIENTEVFYEQHKNKHHCVLIWLEAPRVISAFAISKQGFGAMAAWLSVKDIAVLARKH